jgi:site-specific recombinase XerD
MIGEESLPAQPITVANFLQSVVSNKITSATIRRKVSSISAIHRLSGLTDPTKSPEVKLVVRKMHRQLGRIPAQAYGVSLIVLEKLISDAGDGLRGLRDKALLLIGFDTLRRRAELVSLRIEDLEWNPRGGGTILLRRSKTDQDGAGKYLHLTERTLQSIHPCMARRRGNLGWICFTRCKRRQQSNPWLGSRTNIQNLQTARQAVRHQ